MNFVSAMDSIVDSINETVRKYCVDDSKTSPGRRAPATTASLLSTSPLSDYRLSDYSAGVASSAADSRSLCPSDVFASPHSSAALNHSFALSNSAGKTSASTNNNAAEVSFAMLARQTLKTPESANHRPAVFSSKPESVDVGVQVSPMDFSCDDVSENTVEQMLEYRQEGMSCLLMVIGAVLMDDVVPIVILSCFRLGTKHQ